MSLTAYWNHGRLILLLVCGLSAYCQTSRYPQPILQTGETGQAWSMDFSPDGAFLAVANDYRVSLWDREHKWLLRQLVGHTARVQAVAFGPTGKILASGSSNGEVATWDVETGALLKLRKANSSEIAGLKYTGDGKILTAGWDSTVRIWDDGPCESSCILTHTPGSPQSLAISFDDQFIAMGDTADTVTVWRVDFPRRIAQMYQSLTLSDKGSADSNFIRGIAFDKLGRLAAVDFSGGVVLQDVKSWTTIFQQHTGLRLDGVVISPDGTNVYVAGAAFPVAGRILSFNAKDGSRATLYENAAYWTATDGNPYRSIAMTRDGRWLLAGGTYFLQWDLTKQSIPQIFALSVVVTPGTSFSPVVANSIIIPLQGVHFFSLLHSHFATLPRLGLDNPVATPGVGQTAVSADGRYVATPGLSREFIQFFRENCSSVPQAQQPACGQDLLQKPNVPPTNALMLFRGSDLTYMSEFEMDEDPYPQFSDDGELLLWRTKEGIETVETTCLCNKRRFELPLPDEGFFDLALDASAKLIATPQPGTNGKVVQVYNLETRRIQTLPLDGSRSVRKLVFNSSKSDDMKALAIGTTSGDTYIWRLKDEPPEKLQGTSPVTALAFNHDGTHLGIGRESGAVSVLSLASKEVLQQGKAHPSAVDGLRFGFGGRWITSLSADAVQFWDSRDLSNIGTLIFPSRDGTLSWLFVNPQGLFEGESRALGSMLWRFSPRPTDVGPVELFTRDYYCQGLMKGVLQDPLGSAPVCKPPAIVSRNRHLPVLKVTVDIKDRSELVKAGRVTVAIHLDRFVLPGHQPEGVKDVRLFRNGVLLKHWEGLIPPRIQDLSIEAPITPGVNEFTANALNSDNVKSLDASDGVVGDRSLARPGTTFILSIGVGDYSRGIPSLRYSGNDARAFAEAVKSIQAGRSVRAATLVDAEATRDNILCGLRRLRSNAKEMPSCSLEQLNQLTSTNIEDSVYIYFSGHGLAKARGFSILPNDASYLDREAPSKQPHLRSVISDVDLERELEPILAAQQVLVLDACSAGSLITEGNATNARVNLNSFGQLAREKGIYVLAAATARQAAMEGPTQGAGKERSIMNYVLIEEGIQNKKADSNRPDGSLMIEDWFNYAVSHVPNAADQQPVAFLPMRQENTQTGTMGYFRKQ